MAKLNTVASLAAGLAIIVAAAALIAPDLVVDGHAISVNGLSVSSHFIAAAIIGVALAIIVLNFRSALALLKSNGNAASVSGMIGSPANSTNPAAQVYNIRHPSRDGFESGRLVALSFIEPRPDTSSADMELIDAVHWAFRESQGTRAASFAMAVANHPDDIIKMYATFIAEHIPIYGRRAAETPEPVSLNNPLKEFAMEKGELVLKQRDGSEFFTNLTIKTDDFCIVLERLKQADAFS